MKRHLILAGISLLIGAGAADAQPLPGQGTVAPLERQPRFMIELVDLTVRDETGIDTFGSDEVIVVMEAEGMFVQTPELGDLDRGETHSLPEGTTCAWPLEDAGSPDGVWTCRSAGAAGPATLTFALYENDGVARAFWEVISRFDLGFCLVPAQGDIRGGDCLENEEIAQEVHPIGRVRVVYTPADLVAGLPTPGSSLTETLRVDDCSENLTIRNEICASGWPMRNLNGVYDLGLRVTRLSDVIVEPLVEPQR